jgi:hypothetical protein
MKLTSHSIDRGKERVGLSPKSFKYLAQIALNKGIRHSEVTGRFKKYFDKLYLSYKNANNIRVYGEHVYLFCGETLVTVFHLPNEFKALVKKLKQ